MSPRIFFIISTISWCVCVAALYWSIHLNNQRLLDKISASEQEVVRLTHELKSRERYLEALRGTVYELDIQSARLSDKLMACQKANEGRMEP